MEIKQKEFIFEEHVAKTDYSSEISKLEKKIKRAFFASKKKEISEKVEDYKALQKNTEKNYNSVCWFFNEMNRQKKCRAIYYFTGDAGHVEIGGSGIETALTNGKPKFYISDDKKSKSMVIPVTIGKDDCNLLIFSQPQIELPLFGKLMLKYNFRTEFNLFETGRMTKDINKAYESCTGFEETDYYFYGDIRNKKVNFRTGDALWEELMKSIFDNFNDSHNPSRENYNLGGQIYISGEDTLFYQGNFECDGTFPFFIRGDNNKNKEKNIITKSPELAKR